MVPSLRACLGMVACGLLALWAAPVPARSAGTLVLGMAQFPPDLHPFVGSSGAKATVLGAIRRGLFAYGPDGAPLCGLCMALPTLANGGITLGADGSQDVTLTLRPDLAWADGVKLTTADLERGLIEARAFTGVATQATVVDARTIRYHLPRPTADFARALPDPVAAHVETGNAPDPLRRLRASAFTRGPATPGLWNGPYRLTEVLPNQSVALEPNPYWSGPKPAFQHVELRLIENTAALLANLLAGDIDVVSAELGLSFDQTLTLAHDHADQFTVSFAPGDGIELLAVQLDNPLLADRRVRQAILQAIDRATISARLFDRRQPVADNFLPPDLAVSAAAVQAPFDPAAARRLLAAAGFTLGNDGILRAPTGPRFSIPLTTTAGNRVRELIEQVIQTQLRAVGIEVTINNQPARVLFGETLRQRRFEGLVLYNFGLPPGLVPVEQFHSHAIPTAANLWRGLNYPGLADPRMDAALDAASAALAPATQRIAWTRIQALYAEDLPTLPLLASQKAIVTPGWLAGLAPPRERGMMTLWIEDWRPR